MKAFVWALLVLILIVGIVIFSACTMGNTTEEMLELLEKFPATVIDSGEDFHDLFSELHETWQSRRWLFRCFVGHSEADLVDDGMGELRVRYVSGDLAGYLSARRTLIARLDQIKRSEEFHLDSLF